LFVFFFVCVRLMLSVRFSSDSCFVMLT